MPAMTTPTEALAAALVGSELIARYREYAHAAHPGTMQPDMGSSLSDQWAERVLASLSSSGWSLVRTEGLARLAELDAKATLGPWIRRWASLDVHHMTGDDALQAQGDIDLAVAAVDFVRAALRP